MAPRITEAQFTAAITAVVEQRGRDYVYSRPKAGQTSPSICLYVHTDETNNRTPGCIIGATLVELGISLDALSDREGHPGYYLIKGWNDSVYGLIRTSEKVRNGSSAAQEAQDAAKTWGDALDTYLRFVR